jgi:TolB-like protein/tRNA A-37 threonylcarbamoyl transferase component Bud32/Flp pilus assembly protein TadD
MTLPLDTKLGPYEIVAPLGAGGMGEVYRSRDTRLGREVAIKVLPPSARNDDGARARFRREALALSRLNHPNIEMVLDLGEQDGTDYLVLELVPGETLATRLARGRIPEREAAQIAAQVADALTEAHDRGVLHRDLKPGNIMVTPAGRVKVLDFGLAKFSQVDGDTASVDLTRVGSAVGTLAYMAPEQLLDESLDGRMDLYALGVVLYEMTTAQKPFRGAIATALANDILHGRVAPPRTHEPGISAHAEAVILRAIERESSRRYQTAGEMAGELRRIAEAHANNSDGAGPAAFAANAGAAPARRITSIAVLPLENLSGDPSQEFFSDGMTEELIACFAQVRALRIPSRHSVMRYKGQHRSVAEIARELNVDAVVEGSVRRAGDRVRITAQLIDASTERHLWARSYERDTKEVLTLQGEVATAIVDEIQVSMTPQEETRLKDTRTVNPEAYDSYLRGRHFIAQRSEKNIQLGLAAFDEAVRLDPTLELAHVGVADAYNIMGFMSAAASRETFPRAQAAAHRALEVNPTSGEAFNSLAYATLWFDWNHVEAERLFRRAIDLNPRNSQTHLWFTNLLLVQERFDEAENEARTARILDPHSKIAITLTGWRPYWQGDLEEAFRKLNQVIELIPDFGVAHYWLSLACAFTGRDAEAMAALQRCVETLGRTPTVVASIGVAHALAGRVDEAHQALAELEALAAHRYVGSYFPARVHVALGQHDAALTLLEAALEERVHWLAALHLDPTVAALRGQPRFEALIAKVKKGG